MSKTKTAEDENIFYEIEKRDEQQIVSELQGEMLQEFIYEVRGKPILSWAGIKYAIYKMRNVLVEDLTHEELGDVWLVKCRAHDVERNIAMYGISTQSKKMKLSDGTLVDDDFALQKATSKSQRNALRSLLPESLIAEMVNSAVKNSKKSPSTKKPKKPVEEEVSTPPSTTTTTINNTNNLLDYKKSPITNTVLELCSKGAIEQDDLMNHMKVNFRYAESRITEVIRLMVQDGLLFQEGTKLLKI